MKPFLILIAGPPGCGKDSIAKTFCKMHPEFAHRKFAEPIREWLTYQWGVLDCEIEARKNDICSMTGKTYRRMMIDYSEKFMKPIYGNTIFGELMLRRVPVLPIIFSDSGFASESLPFLTEDKWEIQKFDIVREGTSFVGDSRSYWRHPSIPTLVFNNCTTLESAAQFIWKSLQPGPN